jgi:hypothetical protein
MDKDMTSLDRLKRALRCQRRTLTEGVIPGSGLGALRHDPGWLRPEEINGINSTLDGSSRRSIQPEKSGCYPAIP